MTNENVYNTLDVYRAAYLCLRGHECNGAYDEKRSKYIFVFQRSKKLESDLNNFHKGDKVDVMEFTTKIKELRGRIYQRMDKSGGSGSMMEKVKSMFKKVDIVDIPTSKKTLLLTLANSRA